MSYNIFFISDTHFGDNSFYTYTLDDGSPARKFKNYIEADEYMIEKYNNIINPMDRVYFLGDLGVKKVLKEVLPKLNGRKVLIKGNHDTESINFYKNYFDDIRAYHIRDKILMFHIPVHPYCKGKNLIQIHGHTHTFKLPDKWYFNCCVENHDYTPISYDIIKDYANNIEPQNYLNHRQNIWVNCSNLNL